MSSLNGKFIVLDGPDGCGKTTQSKLLSQWVQSQGVDVVSFRDPGTTAAGEAIRAILLGTEYGHIDDAAEVMLYMAARIQLWHENIAPALETGKCVIMDRWLSSTCAYQGYAGGFGMERVVDIAALSLERLWPDITVLLDIDVEQSSARLTRELDRMELKGQDYHRLVEAGYKELATRSNDSGFGSFVVVNAVGEIEQIHNTIINVVEEQF
ncbi:MAG: dTMP kinase [Sedimentisphaeraceae bacterium JB056]